MALQQFQVDAFTDQPFAGNPAAVVLLGDAWPDPSWMQSVAAENNLSETAFVTATERANAFGIRWFTPTREIDLCGHATLASAHTLWEQGVADPSTPITLRCAAHGELACERDADGRIALDFPADPPEPVEQPAALIDAIGMAPADVLRGREDFLFVVEQPEAVRRAMPDLRALALIDARGVIVTARGADGIDVVSRCFFPRFGIDEDPVTGSAHCTLGPYWAAKLGKDTLRCRQASARGGDLRLTIRGERVRIAGHAVTTIRGELVC